MKNRVMNFAAWTKHAEEKKAIEENELFRLDLIDLLENCFAEKGADCSYEDACNHIGEEMSFTIEDFEAAKAEIGSRVSEGDHSEEDSDEEDSDEEDSDEEDSDEDDEKKDDDNIDKFNSDSLEGQ